MITSAVSRWCRILLCSAGLLVCARPAAAEWQYAPFFGWVFGGHTSFSDLETASADMHRAAGVTVTRLGRGPFGFEGTALYVPGFFNDPSLAGKDDIITSSRVVALMGNLVLTAPQRWNQYGLRPYLSGGLGLLRVDESDDAGAIAVHQRLFAGNIGGGAVGFITDRSGLRFDLRFYGNVRNLADTEGITVPVGAPKHLRFWAASIGWVIR